MNTVAWLNEYSSMKKARRHGKGESAIRFLNTNCNFANLALLLLLHIWLVGGVQGEKKAENQQLDND